MTESKPIKEKTIPISIRMPVNLHEKLWEVAIKEKRGLSGQICYMLDKLLAKTLPNNGHF